MTRKSGGAERSVERALQKNDGAERGVAERERSGGYRIRLERGAAFSPAPLRSHALQVEQRRSVHIWRKTGNTGERTRSNLYELAALL